MIDQIMFVHLRCSYTGWSVATTVRHQNIEQTSANTCSRIEPHLARPFPSPSATRTLTTPFAPQHGPRQIRSSHLTTCASPTNPPQSMNNTSIHNPTYSSPRPIPNTPPNKSWAPTPLPHTTRTSSPSTVAAPSQDTITSSSPPKPSSPRTLPRAEEGVGINTSRVTRCMSGG